MEICWYDVAAFPELIVKFIYHCTHLVNGKLHLPEIGNEIILNININFMHAYLE